MVRITIRVPKVVAVENHSHVSHWYCRLREATEVADRFDFGILVNHIIMPGDVSVIRMVTLRINGAVKQYLRVLWMNLRSPTPYLEPTHG